MPSDDRRPVGKRERFFKLARMSASVATNTASGKVRGFFQDPETRAAEKARTDDRSGELIARTLG